MENTMVVAVGFKILSIVVREDWKSGDRWARLSVTFEIYIYFYVTIKLLYSFKILK